MLRRIGGLSAAAVMVLFAACPGYTSGRQNALADTPPVAGAAHALGSLSGPPKPSPKGWTADNGNGTYSNPLFYEEFEDPDVIRVGTDYYLAGTTMHMMPSVMLMHSKDLVNWELGRLLRRQAGPGPGGIASKAGTSMARAFGRHASAITTACSMFSATSTAPTPGLPRPRTSRAPGNAEPTAPASMTCRCSLMTTSTRSS